MDMSPEWRVSTLPPASSHSAQLLGGFLAFPTPGMPVWIEQPCSRSERDLDGSPSLRPPLQIRSVIRRSRETGHAHPMSREPSPRRRPDPATLSRTPSQEWLIAELQGRLGIQPEAEGAAGTPAEDWLTEGIVITVQPRAPGRRAGGQLGDKVAGCQGRDLSVLASSWLQWQLEG